MMADFSPAPRSTSSDKVRQGSVDFCAFKASVCTLHNWGSAKSEPPSLFALEVASS